MCHGDTRDTLHNRRDFLAGLGIDYHDLVCGEQVHGTNTSYAGNNDKGKGALVEGTAFKQTDGLITDCAGVPLAIFTADCLSVFLYDPKCKAIGLAHAGWKGTQAGIVSGVIALMRERFKSSPDDLWAGLGPAIRSCCYEVGEEFGGLFDTGLSRIDNRYHLDLAALNKRQLLESGVRVDKISDCGICTSCRTKDFFSFRREGDSCGRTISVMMLK